MKGRRFIFLKGEFEFMCTGYKEHANGAVTIHGRANDGSTIRVHHRGSNPPYRFLDDDA